VLRKIIVFCFVLLAVRLALSSQTVLPPDGLVPGWARSEPAKEFRRGDLFDYIDGGAEIFLEFGFDKLLVQSYKNGASELVLEVYQMENPDSALGIYLMKCGLETPIGGIPDRNSGDKTQFTILKGRSFIHINNMDGGDSLLPSMVGLAQGLLKAIPQEKTSVILDQLPQEGRVKNSERLIRGPYALESIFTFGRGDVFKLGGKIFALAADYQDKSLAISTRLVINYPDETSASAAFQNLLDNLDPYLRVLEKGERGLVFLDYRKKFGMVERTGSRLDARISLSAKPKLS
jgi:Family of unknown function (DUF6599)